MQRKTTAEFKAEVYKLTGRRYTVLTKYTGYKRKVKFRHNLKHPHTFWMRPTNFLSGERCPVCSRRRSIRFLKKQHHGANRKNTRWYKKKVYALVGDKFTVMSPYVNARAKIKLRHNLKKHPHCFWIRASNFLVEPHCCVCTGTPRVTTAEYKRRVYKRSGDEYTVLGPYKSSVLPIKMRHNTKHPHTFMMSPANFIDCDEGCPKCYGTPRKTTAQFKREVKKIPGHFTVLSKYITNHDYIYIRHDTVHPHVFKIYPNAFLERPYCPICAKRSEASHGERLVKRYLVRHGWYRKYRFHYGYRLHVKYQHRLHADFYSPVLHTVIEFDGEQHFKPVNWSGTMTKKQQYDQLDQIFIRDTLKDTYCLQNHIHMIRIECRKSMHLKYMKRLVNMVLSSQLMAIVVEHTLSRERSAQNG